MIPLVREDTITTPDGRKFVDVPALQQKLLADGVDLDR